jgi:hypothetical protein
MVKPQKNLFLANFFAPIVIGLQTLSGTKSDTVFFKDSLFQSISWLSAAAIMNLPPDAPHSFLRLYGLYRELHYNSPSVIRREKGQPPPDSASSARKAQIKSVLASMTTCGLLKALGKQMKADFYAHALLWAENVCPPNLPHDEFRPEKGPLLEIYGHARLRRTTLTNEYRAFCPVRSPDFNKKTEAEKLIKALSA